MKREPEASPGFITSGVPQPVSGMDAADVSVYRWYGRDVALHAVGPRQDLCLRMCVVEIGRVTQCAGAA